MALMKYETKITLFSSYFDMNDNLSVKSILNIFQDLAGIHADDIGVGYEDMLAKNLYWILSRIKFDVLKMPVPNQTVIAQTWPREKGRVDFDREFKILSEDGETLIVGTSKWCVIDTQTRSLQRTENVNYIGEVCPDVNYEDKFAKIVMPDEKFKESFSYEVRFSDLDHNKHMNNTNYAVLCLNAIENKIVSHFEINFLSECLCGDKLVISVVKTEEGEYVSGKNGEKQSFVAYIK